MSAKKTQADRERFVELRAEGRPFSYIAKELGTCKEVLIRWSRELEADVANAKALRLDALAEQYAVGKATRIRVFGERLAAILAELDKRDLADVPTDKLLRLALAYGDRLREEDTPLVLQGEPTDALDDMFGPTRQCWKL
jgi:hypothetical protein